MTPISTGNEGNSGADRALVPTASSQQVVSTKGFDHGELERLAERCEAATGLDRELDCAIYNAIPDGPNRKAERLPMEKWGDRFDDGWRTMWADREDKYPEQLKRYTASLDAAARLAPEGHDWLVRSDGAFANVSRKDSTSIVVLGEAPSKESAFQQGHRYGNAATPALALCAAALRAHAAQVGRNAKRQDRNGLGPKDEHAVVADDAPETPPSGENK